MNALKFKVQVLPKRKIDFYELHDWEFDWSLLPSELPVLEDVTNDKVGTGRDFVLADDGLWCTVTLRPEYVGDDPDPYVYLDMVSKWPRCFLRILC